MTSPCPDGEYHIEEGNICKMCPDRYAICTSEDSGQECRGLQRKPLEDDCICQDGFYEDSESYNCLQCPERYNLCQDFNTPLSCKGENRKEKEEDCVCLDGFFEDSLTENCLECPERYGNCSDQNTPLSCDGNNRKSKENDCVCLDGFYEDSESVNCISCQYPCKFCRDLTDCIDCKGDMANRLTDSSCLCQDGYYDFQESEILGYKCLQCQEKYSKCSAENTGIECQGKNRKGIDFECECMDGYFEDPESFNCIQCSYKCQSCLERADNCTSCKDSENRDNLPNCECKTGFFDQNVAVCGQCQYPCLSCENTAGECKSCVNMENREENIDLNCACKSHFYDDGGKCAQCQPFCSKCNENSCSECVNNTRDSTNLCSCKVGYFPVKNAENVEQDLCEQCGKNCFSCEVGEKDTCIQCLEPLTREDAPGCECKVGYYENLLEDGKSQCLKCADRYARCTGENIGQECQGNNRKGVEDQCICLDTFYEDPESINCIKCQYPCKNCESLNTCIDCQGDMENRISMSSCLCENGYYDFQADELSIYECVQCQERYAKCSAENKGLECQGTNRKNLTFECQCLDGYFEDPDSINCLKCSYKCQNCVNNAENCTTCADSENRENLPQCDCKSGFADEGEPLCAKCEYPCLNCENNAQNCLSCVNTENREGADKNCVCKSNAYDLNLKCVECIPFCAKCDKEGCMECVNLTRNPDASCTCKVGYYSVKDSEEIEQEICLECNYKCLRCEETEEKCTECKGLNRQNVAPQCLCEQGYFDDKVNSDCVKCSPRCKECQDNKDKCLSCSDSENREYSNDCKCKSGYHDEHGTLEICIKCPDTCHQCESSSKCTQCKSNTRVGDQCQCGKGFFENENGDLVCEECSFRCSYCVDRADKCIRYCPENRELIELYNACPCAVGYYEIENQSKCEQCGKNCYSCTDQADQCDVCFEPETRNEEPGCECKDGYYETVSEGRSRCLKCDPKCKKCQDLPGNCLECADIDTRNQDDCSCKTGYFQSGNNAVCGKCGDQCQSCEDSADNCTECVEVTTREEKPSCACLKYHTEMEGEGQCTACNSKCEVCKKNDPNYCEICKSTTRYTQNCICKGGHFETNQEHCEECSYKCVECRDQADNCLVCPDDVNRDEDNNCDCLTGYYDTNNQEKLCQKCGYKCSSCEDFADNCLSCKGEFRDLDNGCSCMQKYFENEAKECQLCGYKCAECDGEADNCITCEGEFRDGDKNCICQDGYYENEEKKCVQCDYKCSKCQNGESCTECKSDRDIADNCSCPIGFFDDKESENPICQECNYSCKSCKDNGGYCLECANETRMILDDHKCLCKNGYFEIIETQQPVCGTCEYYCSKCENSSGNCLECKAEENRQKSMPCQCNQGYYSNQEQQDCQVCHFRCESCQNKADSCLSCKDSLNRILESNCTCKDGYFEVEGVSECQKCHFKCKKCENTFDNCLECADSLGDGEDQTRILANNCECQVGLFNLIHNSQCQSCKHSCNLCDSSDGSVCLSCSDEENRLLSENCACKQGFYDEENGYNPFCKECNSLLCKSCRGGADKCVECSSESRGLEKDCACIEGFYEVFKRDCMQCGKRCKRCENQQNNCLQCAQKRENEPQCTCILGYYESFEDGEEGDCIRCALECIGCVGDKKSCSQCNLDLPYRKNEPPNCSCIDGYHDSTPDGECTLCPSQCSICQSETQCSVCKEGFFLSEDNTCLPCSSRCKSCVINEDNCTSCNETRQLDVDGESNDCVCIENYYEKEGEALCTALCHYSCLECEGKYDNCISCKESDSESYNRELREEDGVCSCREGLYDEGVFDCAQCRKECSSCESYDKCLSCKWDQVGRLGVEGNCLCKEGFVEIEQEDQVYVCEACQIQCRSCEGSQENCRECRSEVNRREAPDCSCLEGYYADEKFQCQRCSGLCQKCEISAALCTECAYQDENLIGIPQCWCKESYYTDMDGEILCQKCKVEDCLLCDDNIDICTKCDENKFKVLINLEGDLTKCGCISGYYEQIQDSLTVCVKCNEKCKECNGNADNCTECHDQDNQIPEQLCQCKDGLILPEGSKICQQCDFKCKSCDIRVDNCVECVDLETRVLFDGQCQCKEGYYEDDSKENPMCLSCDYKCGKCVSMSENCQSCSHESRSLESNCECKEGFFDDNSYSSACQSCNYRCRTCVNENSCLSCVDSLTREAPDCYCKKGYFENEEKECIQCKFPCLECEGNESNCTVCTSIDEAKNRETVPTCNCFEGYFEEESTQKCQRCHNICGTCVGYAENCTSCGENRDGEYCNCKENYIPNYENLCVLSYTADICEYQCNGCTGSSDYCAICTHTGYQIKEPVCGCTEGYTFNKIREKCELQCEDSQYLGEDQQCHQCSSNCVKCEVFADNCTECTENREGPNCVCKENMIPNHQNVCVEKYIQGQCEYQCQECTGTTSYCANCRHSTYQIKEPVCGCNEGFEFNQQTKQCEDKLTCLNSQYLGEDKFCHQCSKKCAQCEGSAENCTECAENREGEYCHCKDNMVPDFEDKCVEKYIAGSCESQCLECTGSAGYCSRCKHSNYQVKEPTCGCNEGYYDLGREFCERNVDLSENSLLVVQTSEDNYGYVCDYNFDSVYTAQILCREKGYKSIKSVKTGQNCSNSMYEMSIFSLECGKESEKFEFCSFRSGSEHQDKCGADSCIKIECSNDEQQQQYSLVSREQMSLVFSNNAWKAVCSKGFLEDEGKALCRKQGQDLKEIQKYDCRGEEFQKVKITCLDKPDVECELESRDAVGDECGNECVKVECQDIQGDGIDVEQPKGDVLVDQSEEDDGFEWIWVFIAVGILVAIIILILIWKCVIQKKNKQDTSKGKSKGDKYKINENNNNNLGNKQQGINTQSNLMNKQKQANQKNLNLVNNNQNNQGGDGKGIGIQNKDKNIQDNMANIQQQQKKPINNSVLDIEKTKKPINNKPSEQQQIKKRPIKEEKDDKKNIIQQQPAFNNQNWQKDKTVVNIPKENNGFEKGNIKNKPILQPEPIRSKPIQTEPSPEKKKMSPVKNRLSDTARNLYPELENCTFTHGVIKVDEYISQREQEADYKSKISLISQSQRLNKGQKQPMLEQIQEQEQYENKNKKNKQQKSNTSIKMVNGKNEELNYSDVEIINFDSD